MNGPMDPPDQPDIVTETCGACYGTGIEEGREWDGYPCIVCHGRKFITYAVDDYDIED